MKTERRHELETNTLAKKLARWIELVKPYSKVFGGVLVAVLVIAVVGMFVRRQAARAEAAAWDAYYQATEGGRPSLDELLAVADEHRNTSVEPWARIAWADSQLQVGARLLFHDRSMAQQFLSRAIDAYLELKTDAGNDLIRQRAIYGLARANETLSHLDRAHQEYAEVGGAFAEAAKARATLIEEKPSKEFYDWFAQAKMPQAVQPTDPGIPGQRPAFSVEGLDEAAATGTAPTPNPASAEGSPDAAGDAPPSVEEPAATAPDATTNPDAAATAPSAGSQTAPATTDSPTPPPSP
jgi:hypothetical protein